MTDLHYTEDIFKDYDHAQKLADGYQFTIDYNGLWYYHAGPNPGPIRRKALAGLFGGAGTGFMAGKGLFIDEDGRYWLKSPDGEYEVDVEDVPFVIRQFEVECAGKEDQEIDFYTNFEELIPLDADHPLEIRAEPHHHTDVLYVSVRKGLKARLGRAVYEDLLSHYVEKEGSTYFLRSRGQRFIVFEAGGDDDS